MKKVTIQNNHAGLVFQKGNLARVLPTGTYWLSWGETLAEYDMSKPFHPAQELNVLLQNAELAALLRVVELGDNEIGLLYRDGLFAEVLQAGKFAFWNGATQYEVVKADTADYRIGESIDKAVLRKPALSPFVRQFKVEPHERGILFVDGKKEAVLEPGNYLFWKNPTDIAVLKADMRQTSADVAGQEVLTKDKAQLRINFTVQYKVTDIVKALCDNKEYERQLYVLMQLTLRELVGRLGFDELMENKAQLGAQAQAEAAEKARDLGVELLSFGVKDIILPGDIREIMNQVLVAEKRAQANIITRREETASTRSLLNTAKLLEENPTLMKLKEMEYMEKIAEKIHGISINGGDQVLDQLRQLFVRQP